VEKVSFFMGSIEYEDLTLHYQVYVAFFSLCEQLQKLLLQAMKAHIGMTVNHRKWGIVKPTDYSRQKKVPLGQLQL
jgi:hypothetical protein